MFVRTCGFESRPRHHLYNRVTINIKGDVAKWLKAGVCKTSIRRFESARRLHIATELQEAPGKSGASSRMPSRCCPVDPVIVRYRAVKVMKID